MELGADPISFAVAFAAGVVSFASPCVLPLVPAYLAFVSGVGLSNNGSATRHRRADVALPTAAFVGGFSLMFAALGASAGLIGSTLLLEQRRTLEVVGGIFIIAMGLLLLGKGVPSFLMRERRLRLSRKPATLAGSALVGVAFAVGWTPCIGPTLAAALTLAAASGQPGVGAGLLFVYSVGLGVPFLIAGLVLQEGGNALDFLKKRLNIISAVGAGMLVLFGVLLATGELTRITAELQSVSPLL